MVPEDFSSPRCCCTSCLDDEEALNSIMKDLAALGRCYTQHISHKPKSRTLLFKQVRALSNNTVPHRPLNILIIKNNNGIILVKNFLYPAGLVQL